jgi:hypothetical protein
MRVALIVAAAGLLAAAPACAADDAMSGYYGNTTISTGGAMSPEIRTHYRADHTFDLTGSMMGMHQSFHGTWEMKGAQLCRTFVGDQPPNTTNPVCTPIATHKVGDSWSMTGADGKSRDIKLVAGVQ